MYRNAYQRGLLTILFSGGQKPLTIWDAFVRDGYITTFLDEDIKAMVLQIGGYNISTTYIICPKGKTVLGITMPFLVMVVKNLKKYFSFEVTILDDTSTRRRFRVSNFQSTTQILPMCTVMPIGLSEGWNQIQFNLAEFTQRAYKKQFVEVQKLKVNANIRIRRIYFAERLLPEEQLPPEYKLFFPLSSKPKTAKGKENIKPSTSQQNALVVPSGERKGSKADVPRGSKSNEQTQTVKRPSQEVPKIMEVSTAEEKSPESPEAPAAAPAEGEQHPEEAVAEGEGVAPDKTALPEPATTEPSKPVSGGEGTPADVEQPPQEAGTIPEPTAEAAPA